MGFAPKDLEAIEQSLLEGKSITVPESFLPEVHKDLRERQRAAQDLLRQSQVVLRVVELGYLQALAEHEIQKKVTEEQKAAVSKLEAALKEAQSAQETLRTVLSCIREEALKGFGTDGSRDGTILFNYALKLALESGASVDLQPITFDGGTVA